MSNDNPDSVSTDEIPVLSASPEHISQFFAYADLPPASRVLARPYADLAAFLQTLPRNPERTVALRKLLESRDAAFRAAVAVDGRNA